MRPMCRKVREGCQRQGVLPLRSRARRNIAVAGLIAAATLAAPMEIPGVATDARALEYQTDISSKLNPTGRKVVFAVPFKDQGTLLGDVMIEITPEDQIFVQKADLARFLSGVSGGDVSRRIEAMAADRGFVHISDVAQSGAAVRFDPGLQELQLEISAELRGTSDISLSAPNARRSNSAVINPETLAGYVNITAGADQTWDDGGISSNRTGFNSSGRLDLEGVIGTPGFVFETFAAYEGDVDPYICPPEASCVYGHVAGLKRQSSRFVADMPEHEIRIALGDTEPVAQPLQRAADLLGVSLEKSGRRYNPGQAFAATGTGSFRLATAADVEVLVNGASVQHMQLRPGNYNLRDLPVATGANTIELRITDNAGNVTTETFSAYADQDLLAEGETEWAVAAGLPSYLLDNQRTYRTTDMMATGYFRYGLTGSTTLKADLQGDAGTIMGGAGFDTGTLLGIFGLHAAASTADTGSGFAADLTWSLVSFSGLTTTGAESLYFNAEYRSTDFRTPGQYLTAADGILYPEYAYAMRFNASYSLPLLDDVTATLSGRYQIGDEDRDVLSAYAINTDRYGADLTFSAPLTSTANASMMLGYSNELYTRLPEQAERMDGDFRVALRLNVRPDDNTSLSSAYDTLGRQSMVSAYRSEGNGIGRWDTSVDLAHNGFDDTGSVTASAGYYGNRGEVRVSHYANADGLDITNLNSSSTRQRTSVRARTAIAFAGGQVAVGAPVKGGAFAIVAPHETLEGREVTIGSIDNIVAKSDVLGPALVSNLPAHAPSTISVDVADLPIGYSIGRGTFETAAPYKAGYAIEVGSDYSVSAVGTLIGRDGEPVALFAGLARQEGGEGKTVELFTNAEGRFGAEGLAPGRWIIEMDTGDGAAHYVLEVPKGTKGLVQAGTLHPTEGSAR